MTPPAFVRLAHAQDIPGIIALERSTAEAPHWHEAAYRDYLAAPAAGLQRKALWVAVSEGSVAGFAAATCFAGQAELDTMAVADHRRRSGVGSRLLAAAEAWAQQGGAHHLLLEVRSANRGALALYRARGFFRDGVRRAYYSQPADDAVLMRLDLAGQGLAKERADGSEL